MNKSIVYAVASLAIVAGTAGAQTVMPVPSTEVRLATTKSTEELSYLVLDIPIIEVPSNFEIAAAYLELKMNASNSLSAEGAARNTVTIEAYPYPGTNDGKLDVAALGVSSMKRTVRVGNERRIHLQVTDFVKRVAADPSSNRRLIIGSIAGRRIARFESKELSGPSGTKAALVVYFACKETSVAKQPTGN